MSYGGRGAKRPGKDGESKSRELLKPKVTPLKRRSGRLNGEKLDKATYAAQVELGYKQPTINMRGGVGIPGGRKAADVQKFSPLDFGQIGTQLGGILQTSKKVRKRRDDEGVGIQDIRKEVTTVNRRIDFEESQIGQHSLHVGNDIAAVWNSAKGKSKVYDYPDLASKLDERLANPNRCLYRTHGGRVFGDMVDTSKLCTGPSQEEAGALARGVYRAVTNGVCAVG